MAGAQRHEYRFFLMHIKFKHRTDRLGSAQAACRGVVSVLSKPLMNNYEFN